MMKQLVGSNYSEGKSMGMLPYILEKEREDDFPNIKIYYLLWVWREVWSWCVEFELLEDDEGGK